MPVTLDLPRLMEMAQELAFMRQRGVRPRRLGALALDLLLAKATATRMVQAAKDERDEKRAERVLEHLQRLEIEVVRLHAIALGRRRMAGRVGLGMGQAPT